MRWKLFTFIAVFILTVSTFVPQAKVAAQGLARILVVVGVGNNETAEIYLGPGNNSRNPQSSEDPLRGFNFIIEIEVTSTLDGACTQTIEKSLLEASIFGLPMAVVSVSKGFNESKEFAFIAIDGGEEIELKNCFYEKSPTQRVVFQVGVSDRRFKFSDNNSPFPAMVPAGFPHLQVLGSSIADSNGATVAGGYLTPLRFRRDAEGSF